MAYTLRDESEVKKLLEINILETPIVKGLGGEFSCLNYYGLNGQYRNRLNASNNDSISLDNSFTLDANMYFEINATRLSSETSNVQYLTYSSASEFIAFDSAFGLSITTSGGANTIATDDVKIGDNKITLVKDESGTTLVYLNDNDPYTLTNDGTIQIDEINGTTGNTGIVYYNSFNLDGDYFALNEKTGSTCYGSLGGRATRVSDCINDDYRDNTVIQPRINKGLVRSFTESNSDYGYVMHNVFFQNLSDVDIEVVVDTTNSLASAQSVFRMGAYGDTTNGFFQLWFDGGNTDLQISYRKRDNSDSGITLSRTVPSGLINIKLKNLELYINDVLDTTLTEYTGLQVDNTTGTTLSAKNDGDSQFTNFKYHSLKLKGVKYYFNKPSGKYIFGDNVTKVTDKLSFNSANSDYIGYSNTITNIGDYIEYDFLVDSSYVGDFQICTQDSGEDNNLRAFSNGQISLRTKNGTNNVSSSGGLFVFGDRVKVKVQINTSLGCDLYVNDILEGSTPSPTSFTVSTVFKRGGLYSSGSLFSLKTNTETFPIYKGQGTTITGSKGTVITLNTSHGAPNDYADQEIWDIDTDGDHMKIQSQKTGYLKYVNNQVTQPIQPELESDTCSSGGFPYTLPFTLT